MRASKERRGGAYLRGATIDRIVVAIEELRASRFPIIVQEDVAARITGRELRAIDELEKVLRIAGRTPPPRWRY